MHAGTTEQRMVERARIILTADQGLTTEQIARDLDTRLARVSKWRQRFLRLRLEGLQDRPRPGKPARYDRSTERRILEQLDQPPPQGQATWTGGALANVLGISDDQVWRVLRNYGISLQRRPLAGLAGAFPNRHLASVLKKLFPAGLVLPALAGFLSVNYHSCHESYQSIIADRSYLVGKNQEQISATCFFLVLAILAWGVVVLLSLFTQPKQPVPGGDGEPNRR